MYLNEERGNRYIWQVDYFDLDRDGSYDLLAYSRSQITRLTSRSYFFSECAFHDLSDGKLLDKTNWLVVEYDHATYGSNQWSKESGSFEIANQTFDWYVDEVWGRYKIGKP